MTEASNPTEDLSKETPLRAIMLDTVITMVEDKFKELDRTPDPEQMQQIIAIMYQACCPERARVNPENILYEEAIVKDILSRLRV